MKINLQCWWFGRLTINCEVEAKPENTINDLLVMYFNRVIKPVSTATAVETALPKMALCGNNNFIYDKSKTLADYGAKEGQAFTVLAGFSY